MISLTILAIAAIVLASYLTLVQTQTNSVSRSQTWNSAMPIAEAGLEEGLAEVNKGSPSVGTNIIDTSPWGWTNNITLDGWSTFSNGQTSLTRSVSTNNAGSNYYTVTINISSGTPVITSAGVVAFTAARWGSSFYETNGAQVTNAAPATNFIIGRRVQVQTALSPLFGAAIIVKSNLSMNGNGTTIDSFDSSNTNYSTTNGQYVSTKQKAGADVATGAAVVNISLGNGNIYGHVYTAPGTVQSSVQVGSQGAVGDVAWNTNGNSGVEPGYWAGTFNTTVPDVPTPTFAGTSLPSPDKNGNINLAGGNYTVAESLAPTSPLVITAPTTMWVQGSFSIPDVTFSGNGSLILYVGMPTGTGDSIGVSGNGNNPGLASNLQIFGMPSVSTLTLSGNNALIGAIYAPEADFTGNGGGSSGGGSGSLVVRSITLHGHWSFHYDESLKNAGASRGWIAQNWTEIKY